MRRHWLGGMLLTVISATGGDAALAGSPSFDCDKANSPIEKLICGDEELSALDVAVAKAFAKALAKTPSGDVGALRASQHDWRKGVMDCRRDGEPRTCAMTAYQNRLAEL